MMLMNKRRTISLRDPRLRKARTELRTLLRLVWQEQKSELHEIFMNTNDEKIMNEIEEKIKVLDHAYLHGPHGCRLCGRQDLDLTYNPVFDTWYCESCYEFNRKGHENLYP